MSILAHCKSVVSLIVITLNLSFWCVPLLGLALLKLAVPVLRDRIDAAMDSIYRQAEAIDSAWLRGVIGLRWQLPALDLRRDETVIVLANHVSWADILLVQSVIVQDGPILKFLAKRELLYVPLFGLIFLAFDFPVLRRTTRAGGDDAVRRAQDFEALRDACRALRRRPAALMIFVEGTRFSAAKRDASDSPYRHLLKPRVGGFSALLDALDEDLDRVIDLTLIYPQPLSFWELLSGQGLAGAQGEISIEAEAIARADLPRTREARARWLERRWADKDLRIEAVRASRRPR